MPTVEIRFSPLPAHVRTARLMAVAVARRSHVEDSALDEVRLAVGEACSRAVSLHRAYAPGELVTVLLEANGEFVVSVCDVVPTGDGDTDGDPLERLDDIDFAAVGDAALPGGFSLAVISGLVDDVTISPGPGGTGTVVRMTWPVAGA